jgi:foldase protein PrsA
MRQGAPEKGVDLSDEAIDAQIRTKKNVPASADRNVFAVYYREAVRSSGLTTEGYRDVIAADIAKSAIQPMFQQQAPATADQVRFRVIVLTTESDAQAALQRLKNGEDFATVAQQVSQDTASKDSGGEQDWLPRGMTEPALDEALFSLDIGQISDVITGTNALFIIQVEERQDQRETTDTQKGLLGQQAYQQWLIQLRDRVGVTTSLSNAQRNTLLTVVQNETAKAQ